MKVKVDELQKIVLKALSKKFDQRDSELIAQVVMFGQLSGKTSHGIVRLLLGSSGTLAQNPTKKPEIIKKRLKRREKSSLESKFDNICMILNVPYKFVGNGIRND